MASALVALVALVAVLAVAKAGAAGRDFHIDCRASGGGGDGSLARPWRSLEGARGVALGAGDRLLLRRGTVCSGALAPEGSGSRRAPIVIGAYGRGPRPRIEGGGPDAILIRDISHVIVERLEVTNRGDHSEPKRGITVVAERGVVRDVTIRRNHVHHVDGDLRKGAHGSAGIEAAVWGDPANPPQRLHRLVIEENRVEHVSRSGIRVDGTVDRSRPSAAEPWPEASTGVVIRRNRLAHLAGDGIVPTGTLGARVVGNVVSDGNLAGRAIADPRGYVCNAGIWTFNANRTLIERNEVYGMRFNGCDGTGFDVDYNQDRTVIQFNFSHDNEGGFILLCGEDRDRHADVRFNLSVDDASAINEAPCRIGEGRVGSLSQIRYFNNTIVGPSPGVVGENVPLPVLVGGGGFQFRNNIVYATRPSPLPFPCGEHCSHNLFFNMPASGEQAIVADPLFRDPLRRGRGRQAIGRAFGLRPGSPAVGAGTELGGTPRRGYFGESFAPALAPSIGFDQPG